MREEWKGKRRGGENRAKWNKHKHCCYSRCWFCCCCCLCIVDVTSGEGTLREKDTNEKKVGKREGERQTDFFWLHSIHGNMEIILPLLQKLNKSAIMYALLHCFSHFKYYILRFFDIFHLFLCCCDCDAIFFPARFSYTMCIACRRQFSWCKELDVLTSVHNVNKIDFW